jgi:hypothetical protein
MNKFAKYSRFQPWLMALLLSGLVAACGGGGGGRDPILGTGAVIAPTVTAVSPLNKATLVPRNIKKITAAFSKAMDASTLTTSSFTLSCGGTAVTGGGAVTYISAGNLAVFPLPTATSIAANTVCTATVTTGAKDTAGAALASNFVWTFTTGSTNDDTLPRVIATGAYGTTGDKSGATNLPINRNTTATFSEAMDPTTICGPANLSSACTVASFTLTCAAPCTSPSGVVTYLGTTATFNPNGNLAINTLYTSTITTAAKDLAGNAIAANYVWTWTTGSTLDTTAPTITVTNPANVATNVTVGTTIKATFSEGMDQATISPSFTVKETVSGNNVVGTFAPYDSVNNSQTFTPSSNLTANTDYTVTITNGAKDLAANALVSGVAPNPWTFKTGSTTHLGPDAVVLGAAQPYGVLSNTGVTLGGGGITGTRVDGDVGISPAGACVGCTVAPAANAAITGVLENGTVPAADAMTALTAAYNDAVGRTLNQCTLVASGSLAVNPPAACGGAANGTFAPGLYWSGSSIAIPAGGTITLDAQNDPNAVFIFQSESTINSIGGNTKIVLANQAQAKNVFWVAKSSATIGGTTSTFSGTIMALVAVTVNTGTTMTGQAWARGAAVTVQDGAIITVPAP